MTNKEKIQAGLDFINQTNQGYGDHFFKQWKKKNMKHPEFPIPLLYITAYSDDEFTNDFYYFVRDMEIDLDCGCGQQNFLSVLNEEELKPSTFKTIMTQFATDYINKLLVEEHV